MQHLSIDIETYSDIDLAKSGVHKYVDSPAFEVLLLAYAFNNEAVRVIDLACGERIPSDLVHALSDPFVLKHAFNAPFEHTCLSKYFTLPLDQWRCTMVHSLYCGYPGSLSAVGDALGIEEDKRKLGIGRALIRTFCVPCKPSAANGHRSRTLPHHEPEKWAVFKRYNAQDVEAEREIENRLGAFLVPQAEQHLWQLDQVINNRGVGIDLNLVANAISMSEQSTSELTQEAVSLTGVQNPKSVKQLTEWIQQESGEEVTDLKKDSVKQMLAGELESDDIRRVLEIRQELSKTSVKKYDSMCASASSDGRARGLFQFYGANRTGRWAGRRVQFQNLSRNYLETLDHARECVLSGNLEAVKYVYGNVPDTLSQLVRTALIPRTGYTFLVADFSAIEARVIAWLAGEKWRQDVFATHGKIYEASASAMFGVPLEKIVKGSPEYSLRAKGKVAELALGYQGSSGALIAMGALNMGLTEDELPDIVSRWRSANKRIVDLWYSVENAARQALEMGISGAAKCTLAVEQGRGQNFLTIQLPSGRKLYYNRPFLTANERGGTSLYYYGVDQTTKKWGAIPTYGGKLVENITQAIARDCLAEALVRLESAGYSVVAHVHDECIIEYPDQDAERRLEEACTIMGQPIAWAPGLILRADGFVTPYYRKD